MHRIAASILAVALVATTGAASAQNTTYPASADHHSVRTEGAYTDYARVLRVDPVLQSGYRSTRTSSNECYSEDGYYTDNDGYDDRYEDRRYDDRYDDRYDGRNRGYGTETGRNVATVLGGIVGAALGSKVGGGSARYATAAVGSMVGSMAGREVYESAQRNKQPKRTRVTVCDPVREGDNGRYRTANDEVTAYDVTYEYAGREYTTRTSYHPGDRLRVRVDVRAD